VVAVLALVALGCRTVREPAELPLPLQTPAPASPPADPAAHDACNVIDWQDSDPWSISATAMVRAGEVGAGSSDPEFADNSRTLREVALKAVDAITRGDEVEIATARVELGRQVTAVLALCVEGGHLS
jgi:hypothetical protein